MKSNIIAAAILGICLIAAAFMLSGRYYFAKINECAVARGDRWTGKIKTLRISDDNKRCPWWESM